MAISVFYSLLSGPGVTDSHREICQWLLVGLVLQHKLARPTGLTTVMVFISCGIQSWELVVGMVKEEVVDIGRGNLSG